MKKFYNFGSKSQKLRGSLQNCTLFRKSHKGKIPTKTKTKTRLTSVSENRLSCIESSSSLTVFLISSFN
ncbi:hypothetical protein BpHYR1_052672 [Brachionus plicatilis]|uniref:Uncharacterized protein n=1 Tax=Brachionus plicatilis TaxID=10195 RepID=A0A3M7QFQ6_BRAPC|nr:hypothetical protein BpHYR1_052672 [Brachionus plicatilis]